MTGLAKVRRAALVVSLLTTSQQACVQSADDLRAEQGATGQIRASLRLPNGVTLDSISVSITGGPEAITRAQNLSVGDSTEIQFQIGSLPAGPGYLLEVRAELGQATSCSGRAPFIIDVGATTAVQLALRCGGGLIPARSGNVAVDVVVTEEAAITCPVITGTTALPLQVNEGGTISLEAHSSVPATLRWFEGDTDLPSANGALTYRCNSIGFRTLRAVASKPFCSDSVEYIEVRCGPDADSICDGGVPIRGEGPFGVALTDIFLEGADGGVTPPGPGREYYLYFPEGRIAAAEAYFASRDNNSVLPTTVASDLSVSLRAFGQCSDGFDGLLQGPADTISGLARVNVSGATDAIQTVQVRAALCASGPVPEPSLDVQTGQGGPLLPTSTIPVHANGVMDPRTRDAARISGTRLRFVEGGLTTDYLVPSERAMPPGTQQLVVEGIRDLLGRPFRGSKALEILQPPPLADLTFDAQPPTGAVLGELGCVRFEHGLLRCVPDFYSTSFGVIVRLPSKPGAASARVRHRAVLDSSFPVPNMNVLIVAADGTTSRFGLSGVMEDFNAPLLGPAPHYFVADQDEGPPTIRCSYPGARPPQGYELDEIELLP